MAVCRVWVLLVLAAFLAAPQRLAAADDWDWWKTTVVYQIYPRSFQDSDGDGTGDLNGITSRLDHLATLGVGAVWISPIFTSPMADFGYDISDFYNIDPIFGNMTDFDALIVRANELGLRVILDFVPNHSSDECDWFIKSKANDTDYSDYYIWRDPKGYNETGDPIPPNEWMGQFFESVWTWVEERQQFYYHKYNYKQPDLNYRNDKVRREMENVMTYWLNKGAHGFRVDTVSTLVEDEDFPDVPDAFSDFYTTNQPLTYTVVKEWRALVDEYSLKDNITRVLMTEAFGSTREVMTYYGNSSEPGAHFTFNFDFIFNLNNRSNAIDFVNTINGWMENMPEGGTANWVIGNHDQHRVATRYGSDLAAGMAMLTLLLPGVGVVYNGEEIGMLNNWDIAYNETQDPQGVNAGSDGYIQYSRDFERTPFQWDNTSNAGFTSGDSPWLPIHENYLELNLEEQQNNFFTGSFYNMYRTLMDVRIYPAVYNGTLNAQAISKKVLAVSREYEGSITFVVVINLGTEEETVSLNATFPALPELLLVYTTNAASAYSNFEFVPSSKVRLLPHASVVFTDSAIPVSGVLSLKSVLSVVLGSLILSLCRFIM